MRGVALRLLRGEPPGALSRELGVEDNVWLGLNVLVLKGETIGRDAVIGAGRVVSKAGPGGHDCSGQSGRRSRACAERCRLTAQRAGTVRGCAC